MKRSRATTVKKAAALIFQKNHRTAGVLQSPAGEAPAEDKK
jgi:hypothetical protein